MSRRTSTLKNQYSTAIDKIIGSKYETVQQVAQHLPEIEAVALMDLDALVAAIDEAKDFTGITVVASDTSYWDAATKTLHVATVRGLTGHRGYKGDTGDRGDRGEDGRDGTPVDHVSPTSTTNKLGDFSTPGEYDTYTLYGDADETAVLGHFTVLNGRGALTKEEIAYLYELNTGTNKYTDAEKASVDSDTPLDTTATTIPTAINEVRGGLLTEVTARTDEDTSTRDSVGLAPNGDYPVHLTGSYIGAATDVHDATVKLDTALKEASDSATSAQRGIQAELDTVQEGAGLTATGSYTADTTARYTSTATSLKDADSKLDASLYTVEASLSSEVDRATTAETALQAKIDSEVSRATTAETTLQGSITNEADRATTAETALQANIDSTKGYTDTNFLSKSTTTDQAVAGAVQFGSHVTVAGSLHVRGTTTTVDSAETKVVDNQITLNSGETGSGVTAGKAGLEIDRGTLPTYELVFEEATGIFRVGEAGSTAPVATREDSPVPTGIAYWDNGTASFKTTRDISADSIAVVGSVDGRDVSVDGTKLDTIEAGATSDQTAAEIKTAYESNLNTNPYTDAERSYVNRAVPLATTAQTISTAINELHSSTTSLEGSTVLQSELDRTQAGAGLGSTGRYTAVTTSNYISTAVSLKDADSKLDGSLKAVSDAVATHTSGTSNPHSVTKAQVGLSSVPNVDTTNASRISTGTLSADRLPATINADTTGNAGTASTLATPRTIALSGDVVGTTTFNGSGDVSITVDSTGDANHERTIVLPNNYSTITWSKVGELKGLGRTTGAKLTFSIRDVNAYGSLKKQELKVMVAQRGADTVSLKVYSLGETHSTTVTVGYVRLNAFDFDVYLRRGRWNPCSVVGQNSGFNGTLDNFGEVTVEPAGITYAPTHTVLNSDMDTGWIVPTLLNGWVTHTSAVEEFTGARKMPDGKVVMGGLVTSGNTSTTNTMCFLPDGYRPAKTMIFAVAVAGGVRLINVNPDGAVVFRNEGNGSPHIWLSLSGISFPTP